MSEQDLRHMDEIELLTYADGELNSAGAAAVDEHLAACAQCRTRLNGLRSDLDDFVTRHRERKIAARPAGIWPDLTPAFDRLDGNEAGHKGVVRRFPVPAWFAAAAAALVFAVIWNLSNGRTVSAAQLLEKASSTYFAPEPGRRIAIKSRRHRFVRPARLIGSNGQRPAALDESVEDASVEDASVELRPLFEQANFSWDDPLSARSFARWRDQLPQKQDHVTIIEPGGGSTERLYRIRTTTSHSVLSDAALTMRATDLRPLRETLQFNNSELVEITEAGTAEPAPRGDPRVPEPRIASEPVEIRETPVDPVEELRVLAALNEIGADLGDPVEVRKDDARGRLIITGVGIGPARQQQIRDAIRGFPGVSVDFPQAQPLDLGAAREPVPPVTTARQFALDEQLMDSLISGSDAALARAHALRKLADRFPPDAERKLPPPGLNILNDLRGRHVKAIVALSRSIEDRLTGLIGSPPPAPASACADWQECARSVLQASQSFDQILNAASSEKELVTLQAALGRWRRQIVALERSRVGSFR